MMTNVMYEGIRIGGYYNNGIFVFYDRMILEHIKLRNLKKFREINGREYDFKKDGVTGKSGKIDKTAV